MPELPEVETVVRDLRPRLVGRRFADLRVGRKKLRRRWQPAWNAQLKGRQVLAVRRRGKWILLELDTALTLVVHLGMTGQFFVVPGDTAADRHTHLFFDLDNGSEQLRFRDIRRFGSATLFASSSEVDAFFEQGGLGPEPWDVETVYWRERLLSAKRSLKAILLDQRVVAGVGNIYADEALFTARLPPTRLGTDLAPRDAERLRKAVVTVLERAIVQRGSSIRNYVDGTGLKGSNQEKLMVYGRMGEPCRRCGAPVARIRLAGRSTHYCPSCQQG